RLLGIDESVTRFGCRVARGLTPFVGRREAQATLERLAERTEAGQATLVCVAGEAGIGKSRLVHEAIQRRLEAGWRVRVAAGSHTTRGTPFAPFAQIALQLAGLDPTAPAAARARAALRLHARVPETQRAALRLLFGLDPEPGPDAAPEGEALRRAIRETILGFGIALARGRPTLIVIDDVHLADVETRQLLTDLHPEVAGLPLMVIAVCRPEAVPAPLPPHAHLIELDALTPGESARVATALLAGTPRIAPLARAIERRAGGNPLFLEELTATLREADAAARASGLEGALSLTRLFEDHGKPHGLTDVMLSRIDQLAPGPRALIRHASVLGDRFDLTELRAAFTEEFPGAEGFEEALTALLDQHLIEPVAAGARSVFAFRQSLTREVVWHNLLRAERRRMHGAALARLAAEPGPVGTERRRQMARHAYHAGAWEAARDQLTTLCREAHHHLANADALTLFDRALEVVRALPADPDRTREETTLRLEAAA
ncbi:MAG: AAA family ATPase, partial [Pseudomonadota bacterium]